MPAFSLPHAPERLATTPSRQVECSPTANKLAFVARAFGDGLAPLYFRCKKPRRVSCYAIFEWWLLLSQHPRCLWFFTSFAT